ncbi:MAG TPA: tRNA uridine-5-carboxymethylaminomethyl(34) synthesis GTPase MnmE [Myxococcales bacterium]|nr:tRNA uridine-5-carboxymethylaminomethyl(34) synthesis GTPase MnmE [Myxococcales bacterium]
MSATIAAIATGPAPGGIGIIRLSGPLALEAGRAVAVAADLPTELEPRRAYLTRLSARDGALLDEGLLLWFPAPHSYTGEDVVELHAHGSPRLLSVLLAELLRDDRLRLASPGEFSRRAYLNGRMDLARAEAVADLVAAQSEAAARAAAASLRGALSDRVQAVRRPLLALHADLEGVLNFPDEAEGAEDGAAPRVRALAEEAAALLASAGAGQLVRRGAKVALYGPVNAGKSTLFNKLAGEARALVHPDPGTTRDVLEATVELGGLPVCWQDTAGLRAEAGAVEALGVEQARRAVRGADLAVLLLSPDARPEALGAWVAEAGPTPVLQVRGKADLPGSANGELAVSGQTGEGVEALQQAVRQRLLGDGVAVGVLAASERQVEAIRRASEALQRAAAAVEASTLEVVSGELGLALEALGQVTGESATQALLDEVFRRFCIGK